jgi:glycerol kinase
MKYILALDQGTTSSRSLLIDEKGNVVHTVQKEFQQYYPSAGWVEHDAMEIYETQILTCHEVIKESKVKITDIVGIGITNQRETVVLWDKITGIPIHHAIVWQDRRTASFCDELKNKELADLIHHKTGLPIDAYFSASKVNWLLENVPGARKRAESGELSAGTMDTWLIWKMTNGRSHVTDTTNASRTMLFNIQNLSWDAELLNIFDVSAGILPNVYPSSSEFGFFEIEGHKIPISGVAGDQQAALFGQGCINKGELKNTYGTGCFMLMNQGEQFVKSDNGLITTLACTLDSKPCYALEGSVFIGGAAIQWLRDGLELVASAAETQTLAENAVGDDEVVFVPAFVGMGTPYWDMYARGAIFGITRDTNKSHIAKAALQSIAFQVKDVLEAMKETSGLPLLEIKVDGGATANDFLMQFQADILGVSVLRSQNKESTAMGAAFLAGLQVGLWTMDDISRFSADGKKYLPSMDAEKSILLYHNWKKAVKRTLGWLKD